MSELKSRDDIIDYALRNLGEPVIEVNVDRKQCEDRLDEALELFAEQHFDGTERAYFAHKITQDDIDNQYINTSSFGPVNGITGDAPTGSDILSVVKVFSFGNFGNVNMFDVRYQMALTDYFGINRGLGHSSSLGVARYDSTKRYINMIEDMFSPEKMIRFNKVRNKVHLDMDWSTDLKVDNYLVIESYVKLSSNTFTEIFNDIWLKKYVTALIKRQWGQNMSKFDGVLLPGGVSLKGSEIYADAKDEIARIEEELQPTYQLPIDFMTG